MCYRPGCSMPEIWDVEDPANAGRPPLCNLLVKDSKPHFTTVFQNSVYKVLEVIEEWLLPTEKYISNGFNVLLIAHALFLIQIPKTFIGNCFQIENILFGQFECHSDCKTFKPLSVGYCFNAPLKICYANEYMLALDLNICAEVSKAASIKAMMSHDKDDMKIWSVWTTEGLLLQIMDYWCPLLLFLPLALVFGHFSYYLSPVGPCHQHH